MKLFRKLKNVISASTLCLRFPFLYPRNRWDGKYHAGILSKWLCKLHSKAKQEIIITAKVNKEDDYFRDTTRFFDYYAKLDRNTKNIFIKNKSESINFDYSKVAWGDKFEVLGIKLIFAISGLPIIQIQVKPIDKDDNTNYGFGQHSEKLVVNKWYNFWYKAISWIDEQVLDRIFFLPSYTELDAMEPGWRKAFGIQMCKEIRAQLIKDRKLFKWRIHQLKEKWGFLHLYHSGGDKIYNIIHKYEKLSAKTCGVCGKPATKISKGWIYPYCDDCIDPNKKYTDIK